MNNCNRERFNFSLKNKGKGDKNSARSLGMLGHGVCFGGTSRDYVLKKISKMRKIQTRSTPSTSEITCNLEVLAQIDGSNLGAAGKRNLESMQLNLKYRQLQEI